MLYFGAMPFHNFFQPVFQIDSLENTKCIEKDILGYINFNEKLYHNYMLYKAYAKLALQFLDSFFKCHIAIYCFQIHNLLKKRNFVKDWNNPTI